MVSTRPFNELGRYHSVDGSFDLHVGDKTMRQRQVLDLLSLLDAPQGQSACSNTSGGLSLHTTRDSLSQELATLLLGRPMADGEWSEAKAAQITR